MNLNQEEAATSITVAQQINKLRLAIARTTASIEGRLPLTSYIIGIWYEKPSINVYNQLVGAMMTHPGEKEHFAIASELSFLVGLYRMRLHLEGIHEYYSCDNRG